MKIIFAKAMQVGLLTDQYRWILTNLDAHSLDLYQFIYGGTNITTFRILDENHPIFAKDSRARPEPTIDNYENFDELSDDFVLSTPESNPDSIMPVYPDKFYGNFHSSSLFRMH